MLDHQARPAIYSAAMVERILQAYGFDQGGDPEVLPMSQGFGMALAHVRRGHADLVVKQLSPDRPPARIRFALRYHAHLHDAGIPCPRLHRTRDGQELAAIDGHLFCVQDWCPGDRFDPDGADTGTRRRRREQLGSLLGRVHAAATP
ncbi:MAG: phosphotransferase, partial [Krumholzibacteria bacterium]|nr:phosphotransferase [Candidatus Krumholzibacteria bacterium]